MKDRSNDPLHHELSLLPWSYISLPPVMEHCLEREIAQWVHSMKDRSDDPSHHELPLLPRSYISLPPVMEHWLEREIAQWVHAMKDRSDDPSHHELPLLTRSCISLPPNTATITRADSFTLLGGDSLRLSFAQPPPPPWVWVTASPSLNHILVSMATGNTTRTNHSSRPDAPPTMYCNVKKNIKKKLIKHFKKLKKLFTYASRSQKIYDMFYLFVCVALISLFLYLRKV